jgi:hypothetical protein
MGIYVGQNVEFVRMQAEAYRKAHEEARATQAANEANVIDAEFEEVKEGEPLTLPPPPETET